MDVVGFSTHFSIIGDLELPLPATARHSASTVMPSQIAALEGYAALRAYIHGIIPTMVNLGITMALNHVAYQLFVTGL